MSVTWDDYQDAYWKLSVLDGFGFDGLNGIYDSWCSDFDVFITPGVELLAKVFNTYEVSSGQYGGIVESPENFDAINWLLNQAFDTQTCTHANRVYNAREIQAAVWHLVEETTFANSFDPSVTMGSPYNDDCVDDMFNSAISVGEGYIPDCEDLIAVLVVPVNNADLYYKQALLM
jgi:hypothetical protein